MTATMIEMPSSIFNFSGQTHLDTFSIRFEEVSIDFDSYDDLAINGLRLAMEAIRLRADDFSYWQRRRPVGRPAYGDRIVLIAILVQQLMDLSFRETEGMLAMMKDYYSIETVPDHSTICRRSRQAASRPCWVDSSGTSPGTFRPGRLWHQQMPLAILAGSEAGVRRLTPAGPPRTG